MWACIWIDPFNCFYILNNKKFGKFEKLQNPKFIRRYSNTQPTRQLRLLFVHRHEIAIELYCLDCGDFVFCLLHKNDRLVVVV